MKKGKFKKHLRAGIRKTIALEKWEKDGLLSVDPNTITVQIHYLIWHIFSNRGLIKLSLSLYFFINLRRVANGLPKLSGEYLAICVDYTNEPNDYGKQGIVPMVKFHPSDGFAKISE